MRLRGDAGLAFSPSLTERTRRGGEGRGVLLGKVMEVRQGRGVAGRACRGQAWLLCSPCSKIIVFSLLRDVASLLFAMSLKGKLFNGCLLLIGPGVEEGRRWEGGGGMGGKKEGRF